MTRRLLSTFFITLLTIRDCRRSLDLLSERLTTVSLVWMSGHSDILGNYKANELARAGALLPEFSSIDFGMP